MRVVSAGISACCWTFRHMAGPPLDDTTDDESPAIMTRPISPTESP